MKKLYLLIIVGMTLILVGCSKSNNSSNNPLNPISPVGNNNGNGNSNVTITIQSQDTQNGDTEFDAQANQNITLDEIDVTETTGTNYNSKNPEDGTTVYLGNTWYIIAELQGVGSGMKFTFEFIGKTSPGGQQFDVTSNYTVP